MNPVADTSASNLDSLYRSQRHWLDEVLEHQGSLLTPGRAVWTTRNAAELQEAFDQHGDSAAGGNFLDKLRTRLTGTGQDAKQLAAELLVEHFLIIYPGAISQASKIKTIETVLSWLATPAPIPGDVRELLAYGPVHPGQWAISHREIQLTWLIHFTQLWLGLPDEDRTRARTDPWALRALTDSITDDGTEAARLALLHLSFPDTFEAIVSPSHKQQIVLRFVDVPGRETDVDRRLLELRSALSGRDGLDWYSDPLRFRWSKRGPEWSSLLRWVRAVYETQEIRTEDRPYKLAVAGRLNAVRAGFIAGKHMWAADLRKAVTDKENNLTGWRANGPLLDWVDAHPTEARDAFAVLWDADRAPLESLAGFLDCMPSDAIADTVGARCGVGSFLLMARDATQLPPMKIRWVREAWTLAGWGPDKDLSPAATYARALALFEEVVRASADWPEPLADPLDAQGLLWAMCTLADKPTSWSDELWHEFCTYRGLPVKLVPASGSQLTDPSLVPSVAPTDFLAEAAADLLVDRAFLDEVVNLLADKKQVILYGPPGTGKTFLAKRLARALVEDHPNRSRLVQFHSAMSYEDFIEGLRPKVLDSGQVTYEVTPGPLIRAAKDAQADPDARYVLIIDEINRANLPKVFGELLFLLEYREEATYLMYRPDQPFTLPENLLIIGTMNTADRSVALVDAALRRRFHFVPFFPHYGPMQGLLGRYLAAKGGRLEIAQLLDAVNDELIAEVGEHLLIGPSHFMKADLTDDALRRIWTYNVFPLIEEQIWGRREEIDRWRWDAVRRRFADQLSAVGTGTGEVSRALTP